MARIDWGYVRIISNDPWGRDYFKGEIRRYFTKEDNEGDRSHFIVGELIRITKDSRKKYQGVPIRRQDFEELTYEEIEVAELLYG